MEHDDYYDLKIILWLILFLVFGIIIITCKPPQKDYIMTVNGPVRPSELGSSLEHEHILVDFIGADSTGYFRWNRDSVSLKVLPFLFEAKEKGMKTFFECTPAYLGRDPVLLKSISQSAGINIITNTGYYGSNNNKYIPESFYGSEPSEIATLWVREFTDGIEGTGIRPGFIKIAVNPSDSLSKEHIKIITAAAMAHLKTGMVIASHTGAENPAFAQIEVLKKMGVDPSAFIWVHAQSGSVEGNIKAAREGAWISLDNIHSGTGGAYSLDWYADRIVQLKDNGLLGQVLISHDSGWYDPSARGGGNFRGFTDIYDAFVPLLRQKGLTEKDIDQILVINPQNAFKIMIRRSKV